MINTNTQFTAGPHREGWSKLPDLPNLSLSGVKFLSLFWYLSSILSPFSVLALKGAEDRLLLRCCECWN